jgi:hypothetical protein
MDFLNIYTSPDSAVSTSKLANTERHFLLLVQSVITFKLDGCQSSTSVVTNALVNSWVHV